jgi:hypothetical protein
VEVIARKSGRVKRRGSRARRGERHRKPGRAKTRLRQAYVAASLKA